MAEEGKLGQDAVTAALAGFTLPGGKERGDAAISGLMVNLIEFIREDIEERQRQSEGQPEAATIQQGASPDRPLYVFDVRPRDEFAFAPESFFFRNRGAGTSRAVSSTVPLPRAQAAPVAAATRRARA
jgi:hypothetical protein